SGRFDGIDPSKVDGGRGGRPAARRKDGQVAALSLVLVPARPLLLHPPDDGGDHPPGRDARGPGEGPVLPAGGDDPPAGQRAGVGRWAGGGGGGGSRPRRPPRRSSSGGRRRAARTPWRPFPGSRRSSARGRGRSP